jgi:hypothetical protein
MRGWTIASGLFHFEPPANSTRSETGAGFLSFLCPGAGRTERNYQKNKALGIKIMGRPAGSQNKDKPFRTALRMEIAAAGEDMPALRSVAQALIGKAMMGDVQAIKELGDRLDGRPAQAIVGDDDADPVSVRTIITGVPRAADG